jgi:uncharacterized membrane protein
MTDRSLKLALVASLVANIFLAGGAVGAVAIWTLRSKAEPTAGAVGRAVLGPRRPLRAAADNLAPAQREAFRQALRDARRDAAPSVREGRQQRARLADLLAQPSPDRRQVEAAMAGARAADIAVRGRVEAAVADYAIGLSPRDRAVFVEGLRRSSTLRPMARNRLSATETPTAPR